MGETPLRTCRQCGLKAYTKKDLRKFVKQAKSQYGYQNWCKECRRKYQKTPAVRARARQYGRKEEVRLKRLDYNRFNRRERRRKLLRRLGGKCAHCGFDDWRALQIDHIHGKGVQELNSIHYYAYIKKLLALPIKALKERYQCLCANCNWIKRVENNEVPHGRESEKWKN